MKFSELVDSDELKTCLEEGLISVRYSDDGYEIYNYTNRAMFTPGAWDIPAVLQCRGIIVDPKTQDIIARPWKKFFNHNQPEAGELNLDSPVEVTDKADGSMGIIYRNALGVPCVATRGSFNSDQAIWATQWMKDNEPIAKILWPILDVWTLLVEIVYPDNKIVVDYQDYEGLILLGAVHKERGEYLSPLAFTGIWEKDIVETFPYRSLREALEAKPRPGKEGLCVRYTDSDKIVKIKQEDYLKVHRRVFGLSRKTVWEYVYHTDNPSLLDLVEGLPDEFLTWVTNVWEEIQGRIDRLTAEAHTRYTKIIAELPPNPERKQVAEKILSKENKIYAPLLFKLLDGQDLKDTAMKYIRSEFQGSDRVKVSDESTA